MTRVLLHAFSTFALGGAQSRFVQLANHFGASYRHLIVAMDGCFDAGRLLAPQVRWEPVRPAVSRGFGMANRGPFRQKLRALRPDMVFSYNWGAIEWIAANWPAVAAHVHVEDGFGADEARKQWARRVWARRVLLSLNHVRLVVPSQTLGRIARGWWVASGKTRYVPNGVQPIEPGPAHRHIAAAGYTIGTVSGLRPEKRIDRLIRAFAAVQPATPGRLLVVGEGPERPALQSLALQLGVADRIVFTGFDPEPRRRLAEMDVFALSSDTEQLPISMLDAMAAGLPVLSTAVGDVPFMLPEMAHAGLSAPDDRAYTQALQRVLAGRAAWPAWGQAGRERVRVEYAHSQMVQAWQEIFDGAGFAGGARA